MSLITEHDYFHIHKIIGISSLLHYSYRFYEKIKYGTMFFNFRIFNGSIFQISFLSHISPIFHLGLSLSSFIFHVPKHRFTNKTIIWKELQLHNIIFTSRSVMMIYHCLYLTPQIIGNSAYYLSRLLIILLHHYIADKISEIYQNNNLTTTRDISYNIENKHIIKYNRFFYSISQIIATTTLLLSTKPDNGFIIMFPIQFSAFLMTLVRKQIITNNQWHILYSISLLLPFIIRYDAVYSSKNIIGLLSILHILFRFCIKSNKYINMFCITFLYLQMIKN